MKIGNINLQKLNRPFLVAEAGATHQGDPELALKMTEVAVQAGADALSFQEIDETRLYTELPELPVAPQPRVGWDCLTECRKVAKKAGLCFSVCVTDLAFLEKALSIGIDFVKIVSYDITFHPFLKQCGQTGLPVFMSTGASTFDEIAKAIEVLNAKERLVLYHTDCGYPTKDEEINLKRISRLRERFNLPVGYCDHTDFGLSCMAASALGASVIEKHFIIDRSMGGSDHMVALEPDEIKDLFNSIKRISKSLGDGADEIKEGDQFRRENLRRSIALNRDLAKNKVLEEDDLTMLRPSSGLSWDDRALILGKQLKRDLPFRHILSTNDVKQVVL